MLYFIIFWSYSWSVFNDYALILFFCQNSLLFITLIQIVDQSKIWTILETCRGRSLGFLRLGWTLGSEFEPAKGLGTTYYDSKTNTKKLTKIVTCQKVFPKELWIIFRSPRMSPRVHKNALQQVKNMSWRNQKISSFFYSASIHGPSALVVDNRKVERHWSEKII